MLESLRQSQTEEFSPPEVNLPVKAQVEDLDPCRPPLRSSPGVAHGGEDRCSLHTLGPKRHRDKSLVTPCSRPSFQPQWSPESCLLLASGGTEGCRRCPCAPFPPGRRCSEQQASSQTAGAQSPEQRAGSRGILSLRLCRTRPAQDSGSLEEPPPRVNLVK